MMPSHGLRWEFVTKADGRLNPRKISSTQSQGFAEHAQDLPKFVAEFSRAHKGKKFDWIKLGAGIANKLENFITNDWLSWQIRDWETLCYAILAWYTTDSSVRKFFHVEAEILKSLCK